MYPLIRSVEGSLKTYLFVVFLAFSSCTYTVDKKYYNPVLPPNSNNINIDLDGHITDPYLLDWPTTFTLNIKKTGKPLSNYTVQVDNSIYSGSYQNGLLQFTLTPSLGNGTHNVKVQVYLDTQTGSLADQTGNEHYYIEKTFSVVVDSSLPPTFSIPQPKIENGYLTFRWNLNSLHTYQYYVSKTFGNSPNILNNTPTKGFMGSGQMVYVDSAYVGGYANYYFNVSTYTQPWGTNTTPISVHLSSGFSIETGAANAKTLIWNTKFENASVTVLGPKNSVTVSVATGTVKLDTATLGEIGQYRILLNRNRYFDQAFDSSFVLGTPKNLPAFGDLRIMPQQSKLFIYGAELNDFARYSLPDFTKEDAFSNYNVFMGYNAYPQTFGISSDGSWSSFSNGGPVIIKINPLDFSQHSSFAAEKKQPDQTYVVIPYAYEVSTPSSTGLQGVSFGYNGSKYAAVIDLTVDTQLHQLDGVVWMDTVNTDTPIVSDDGQYFCVSTPDKSSNLIYKNNGTSWDIAGKVPYGSKFFRGHGTFELIVADATIQVFDVSAAVGGNTLQPIRTFAYAGSIGNQTPKQIGYDNPTQNIFIETIDHYNYSTIRLFDVVNFSSQGKARAFVPPTTPYQHRHIYSNNYHFVTSGYGEKLQP